MSMSQLLNQLHEQYENAPSNVRDAIDAAYRSARAELEARGFMCANDDRAEVLIAHLFQYFIDSAE